MPINPKKLSKRKRAAAAAAQVCVYGRARCCTHSVCTRWASISGMNGDPRPRVDIVVSSSELEGVLQAAVDTKDDNDDEMEEEPVASAPQVLDHEDVHEDVRYEQQPVLSHIDF
jgi:hypothetical protein